MELNKKIFTLILITRNNSREILLGLKKKEGLGHGKWNGFGGKVEPGETINQAAVRELFEESEVTVTDDQLKLSGIIRMNFVNKTEQYEVHVFGCNSEPEGQPTETEEMKPQWFNIEDLPYDLMWEEAAVWFPYFLSEKPFRAFFLFDDDDKIVTQDIHTCQAE